MHSSMPQSKSIDRRSEVREPEVELVRYSGRSDLKGKSATFVRFATTINISKSGLCFRSPKPFERSHRLTFSNDQLWDDPREGEVRWCEETEGGLYVVGIALA
jgi:hypothetical protein